MNKLTAQAMFGLLNLIVMIAIFLFLPGWTLKYWQGWLFLGVFGISVLLITLYLLSKDPDLIQRRVKAGPVAEQQTSQKVRYRLIPFIW